MVLQVVAGGVLTVGAGWLTAGGLGAETVIDMVDSTLVTEFSALKVYVVVSVGATTNDPEAHFDAPEHINVLVTVPDAVFDVIFAALALTVFQLKVLELPWLISVGLAENKVIFGGLCNSDASDDEDGEPDDGGVVTEGGWGVVAVGLTVTVVLFVLSPQESLHIIPKP